MDYRFHIKEQQEFYETVLLNKSPTVNDMRWVDWEYIDAHPDRFLHENLKTLELDEFIGTNLTAWNDEIIVQFYSTANFYPDGKIRWMTEGVDMSLQLKNR